MRGDNNRPLKEWLKIFTQSPQIRSRLYQARVEKMWGFIFNMRRAPFDDMRVRKALSLMVDYDWINQNIFHGQYKPLTSFYANSSLAATGLPSPAELALLEPFRAQLPPEGPCARAYHRMARAAC